jgi:serine/threonine protein kinase
MGLKKLKEEHGIKHRDLKPQNILLLDPFTYLIADFTTCKILQSLDQDSLFKPIIPGSMERTLEVPCKN